MAIKKENIPYIIAASLIFTGGLAVIFWDKIFKKNDDSKTPPPAEANTVVDVPATKPNVVVTKPVNAPANSPIGKVGTITENTYLRKGAAWTSEKVLYSYHKNEKIGSVYAGWKFKEYTSSIMAKGFNVKIKGENGAFYNVAFTTNWSNADDTAGTQAKKVFTGYVGKEFVKLS